MNSTTKDLLIRHYEEQLKNLNTAIEIIRIANKDMNIRELNAALITLQYNVIGIRNGAEEIKKGDSE